MYVQGNPKTKKALVDAVNRGERLRAFQPGPFDAQTEGWASVEGPHYPQAHRWYARVLLVNGIIEAVK